MASFAAEPIVHIAQIPITNTLLHMLIVDGLILGGAFYLKNKLSLVPGMFQNIFELLVSNFYSLTETIAEKRTAKIFPYFMTFFLVILVANWTSLIPGVGTIGFIEEAHGETKSHIIPLIRGATSDINVTLGLALVSVVATHIMSVQTLGIKEYLSRYFSLNPLNLFIGVLEIISEITKVISLSFRLFGNIFAGEVVLLTVSTIFAFIIPIPFLMLEIIVGLVQALVFSMLTMVFMALLTTSHNAEH